MADRPILFSAPMVRALLAGTKTQTRRVVKPQPEVDGLPVEIWWRGGRSWDGSQFQNVTPPWGQVVKHRVQFPRLWVREEWRTPPAFDQTPPRDIEPGMPVRYEADGAPNTGLWGRLRPGMFMPSWASRITLEVTAVRVERLWSISRGDAMAEGCPFPNMANGDDPRMWYADLWDQINGPREPKHIRRRRDKGKPVDRQPPAKGAASWDANPWVWVVEFKRVTP